MDQNLKELFLSYTSNEDYMKLTEFKKFIKERKICNIYQAESIFSRFSLNKKLFERIKHVYEHHRQLSPEEQMLLTTSYDGFVRSGALLDEEGKDRLRKITEKASLLSLQFSQNLLKENKAFELLITDESQLDGLPNTAREAAHLAAKEKGKEGWLFNLDFPSYSPFMTYSSQRE